MDGEQESENLYAAVLEAGQRLLAALRDEHRVTERLPNDVSKLSRYYEAISAARKRVDDCEGAYCAALEACGYPEIPIRHVIECGDQPNAQADIETAVDSKY